MTRDERFASVLSRVARAVVRLEREVCCADLTLQQFETLRLLRDGGATALGAIATALDIDISTASRNLALLTRGGYITRRRGKEDARQVLFALSARGTECITSLCCDERVVFAALLSRIPAQQRDSVAQALDVLDAALAQPAEEPACCPPGACDTPLKGIGRNAPGKTRG